MTKLFWFSRFILFVKTEKNDRIRKILEITKFVSLDIEHLSPYIWQVWSRFFLKVFGRLFLNYPSYSYNLNCCWGKNLEDDVKIDYCQFLPNYSYQVSLLLKFSLPYDFLNSTFFQQFVFYCVLRPFFECDETEHLRIWQIFFCFSLPLISETKANDFESDLQDLCSSPKKKPNFLTFWHFWVFFCTILFYF